MIKLQYADEVTEEIAKIDKQCEEGVEEFHQTVDLKKQKEFQKIEEDREIQQRKALEDSEHELIDYQNKLKGKYRVKTAELKKCYQEKYSKLEEEEAEKFHQVKVETADKVIAFQRDQEKFAKEQEEWFEKAKKDIADEIQAEVDGLAVHTRETLEKELAEKIEELEEERDKKLEEKEKYIKKILEEAQQEEKRTKGDWRRLV